MADLLQGMEKAHLHRFLSYLTATASGISSLESEELKFLSFKIVFYRNFMKAFM